MAARVCQHQFLGPIFAYLHREGREYVAYLDPFFLIGTGRTAEEALRSLSEQVGPYFLAVSEQLQKHGPGRVHFTRLSSEYKRGASATFQGVLLASIRRVIRQPEPPPLMAEPINPRMVNRIARYLKSGGVPEDIRLTGLQHVMAR